ncbi:Maf family protein [Parahaliea mediterranea]|uniref:7-methyl-GTP pyrophosphatase n=1 Tax=Parahaliea mediterranea TaxID=651086 RepID=A0A939IMP2_9GAMM|nr:Maf family nucleotide pyrophosphatase [Parahaliea mediterranea]MBN7797730.1 septum formation inhibitor Maf [Parahaliea mediterranea]
MNLILASTSPYRKTLLERLQVAFTCEPPGVVEAGLPGEPPDALAARLARAKAAAIAARHPGAAVIGSDQVAALDGEVLGKPGSHARATDQLRACSGRTVHFYTAVTLIAPRYEGTHVAPFQVAFRELSDLEIDDYLRRDQPYDCAGSFKWESLGITLFERLAGDDPTGLEGLPLIALTTLLKEAGYPPLASAPPSSAGNSDR